MSAEAKKAAKPQPKKAKKQKQSLGEFLGVQKGTSWASDDEEEYMAAPAEVSAKEAKDWRGGSSAPRQETEQRPFASSSSKPLPDRPPYTLYVGNLAFSTTEEEIARFFRNTESVRIIADKNTNVTKGFGYVTFPTREDLATALKLDNQMLGGRALRLDIADNSKGAGGKGKGGSGFGGGGFGGGGFGGGEGGGFSGFAGGRDFMGTGQVERPERPERGGKGGGGGPGGFSRDTMGSGVAEERGGGFREPREAPSFSRDTMGSEQGPAASAGERPSFGGRGRGGFGSGETNWGAGREAMGTGVVEERRPPPPRDEAPHHRDAPAFSRDAMAQEQPAGAPRAEGEARPPPRAPPNRLMFGGSETAPSRDLFGAQEVPERPERVERPERPPRPEPWRPGGGKGAGAGAGAAGQASDWRSGGPAAAASEPEAAKEAHSSPKKEVEEKPRPYQPKQKQTNAELEAQKPPKPAPKVPLTQEELFQQQVAKTQKKEQQAKAAKEKTATQANYNPWEALGKTKKKKKSKKAKEEDDDSDEED